MNNLIEIQSLPTIIGNIHESLYKSYHIVEKVKDMLSRGDSKETILEIIEFLEITDKNK